MDPVEVDSFALAFQVLMPAQERKDEDRISPRWLVRFPIMHGQGMATHFGLAADVNDDGMCFLSSALYAADTIVSLELRIPGGPIHVKALVRYCRNGAIGVQFLNLSREQRLALLAFSVIGQRRKPN
ncbi:MAG: PilZ domain-containing protein [Terriglobales bacterium]